MILINDFFVRYKEAISNQMESIANYNKGKIISATRFMNQKALQKKDMEDNIYIYTPKRYIYETIKAVLNKENKIIHVFEEEPCIWKRIVFNTSKKALFVSMYRRPTKKYAQHLKKYNNLVKVFVELPSHKNILIENGISEEKIVLTPTPPKIPRKKSKKRYNPQNVNILFASWNNKEGDAIKERGLEFLLKLLKANPNYTLTIPLRDNDTKRFESIAELLGVRKRVKLLDIHNSTNKLIKLFDDSDFVAFVPQKRIVKDVPNSLIDGIAMGKPIIISDIIDFSEIVNKEKIGIIYKKGQEPTKMNIDEETYSTLSENAYQYSKNHSIESYLKIIKKAYSEINKKNKQ